LPAVVAEGLHNPVQLIADHGHLALVNPGEAQGPQQIVNLPGAHPLHVATLYHRQRSLLRSARWLQQTREVGPLPQLRDLQRNLPDPGIPSPLAVAVASDLAPARSPIRAAQITCPASNSNAIWANSRVPSCRKSPPRSIPTLRRYSRSVIACPGSAGLGWIGHRCVSSLRRGC
jgi:hypothetical protein